MIKINEKLLEEFVANLDNGDLIINEGILSNIKDKITSKIKDITSYNEWCTEVKNILATRYRMTISELKTIFNSSTFKKCYNLGIRPLIFVKTLMQRYVEYMNSLTKEEPEEEQEIELYPVTPIRKFAYESRKVENAKALLEANGYRVVKI